LRRASGNQVQPSKLQVSSLPLLASNIKGNVGQYNWRPAEYGHTCVSALLESGRAPKLLQLLQLQKLHAVHMSCGVQRT